MTINLFLDSNILLSLYAMSNADVEEVKKLINHIESGDIKLFICDQIVDEFGRNRDGKAMEAFDRLKKADFKCEAPAFVKSMPSFLELQGILKDANTKHYEIINEIEKKIHDHCLDADKVVANLIKCAGVTPTTGDIFNSAHQRFLKGNPPGKKKSTIGDEINWEFLLASVTNKEDLHLISADGDYCSDVNSDMVSMFLEKEWKSRKGART